MSDDDDYRMSHQAPDAESGSPLYDVTLNGTYPRDFYDRPSWYLSGHDSDWEAIGIIRASLNKPDRRLWIYRAVPRGVRNFNTGDWVSITKSYARDHGRHPTDTEQDMPVLAARVYAHDLYTSGDSLQEWGYVGPTKEGLVVFRPRKKPSEEQIEARNVARRSASSRARVARWRD